MVSKCNASYEKREIELIQLDDGLVVCKWYRFCALWMKEDRCPVKKAIYKIINKK